MSDLYSLANSHTPSAQLFEGPYTVEATFNGMPVTNVTYSCKINSQVQWSVTVDGIQDLGSGINVPTGTLQIGAWTSPPLAVLSADASVSGAPTTTYSGSDLYTYRLSSPGITMTTFFDSSIATIVQTIADRVGVTITVDGDPLTVIGNPLFGERVEQFEVQAGSSLLEFISRLCRDFGLNYVVTGSGITLFQGFYSGSSVSDLLVTGMSHKRSTKDIKTKMVLRKKSKYSAVTSLKWDKSGIFTGTFSTPLAVSTIRYTEVAVAGHVGYIAYFSGNNLCGYVVLDANNTPPFPPLTASASADNLVFSVVPNPYPFDGVMPKGELFVYGRPYGLSAYYDVTFELILGDATEQHTDRISVIESSLWPNQVLARTIATYLFQDMNRSADGYSISCDIIPGLLPGGELYVMSEFMTAHGRIEGVSFSVSGGAPSMQLDVSSIAGSLPTEFTVANFTVTQTAESVRDPVTNIVTTTITTTTTDTQTGVVTSVVTTRTTNSIVVTTPTITT